MSAALLTFLTFLAFLTFLPGPSWAQTAEELLQQADAALQKEDYAAAARTLEAYLAQNPQDYRAKFNLALAYSLTGRRAEAIRQYQEVLAQEKDLVPVQLNLGILLLEDGNAAEAAEHLRWVVEKQPEHWTANVKLAEALALLQRVPEARQAYERALQLKPDDAPTHLAVAQLLAATDTAVAEKHLRRALQLDSSLEEARLLLATVLDARAAQGADTLAEAAALYRQHLATHPQRLDLRLRLGQIYLTEKRFPDAVAELEAARAAGSRSAEVNEALLQAYLETKESDQALALLPELIALAESNDERNDERNAELHLLLGSLRMEKRQYPEAVSAFRRSTELNPQSAEGYTNLASALYLMKDYEGTVVALDRVSALGKDTAGSFFLRAISLDKLGRQQPALENYQRFLESEEGKNPDQEFQARQRSQILSRELSRKGRGR